MLKLETEINNIEVVKSFVKECNYNSDVMVLKATYIPDETLDEKAIYSSEVNLNLYTKGLRDRTIYIGDPAGHGPRMKISKPGGICNCHGDYIEIYVDNGRVVFDKNTKERPKDINMSKNEFNVYCNLLINSWGLLCYALTHNISENEYEKCFIRDELRRQDKNNPLNIVRSKKDGCWYYKDKIQVGPYRFEYHALKETISGEVIDLGRC